VVSRAKEDSDQRKRALAPNRVPFGGVFSPLMLLGGRGEGPACSSWDLFAMPLEGA